MIVMIKIFRTLIQTNQNFGLQSLIMNTCNKRKAKKKKLSQIQPINRRVSLEKFSIYWNSEDELICHKDP